MVDDADAGGRADRRAPKRGRVSLADLSLIVRPPGQPNRIRVFTADESAAAEAYAAEHGAVVAALR